MPPTVTIQHETNRVLKPALEAATRCTDFVNVTITPDSLKLTGVAADNAAMATVEIDAPEFDTFDSDPCEFELDSDQLGKAVRSVRKTDPIKMVAAPADKSVTLSNPTTDADAHQMVCSTGDDTHELPDLPQLDWNVAIDVPGDQFKRTVRAGKKLSEYMELIVPSWDTPGHEDNPLMVYCAGSTDDLYGYPDATCTTRAPEDTYQTQYAIDYLREVTLGVDRPASTTITLSFAGDEFPLKCEFQIGDSATVTYAIAPKISGGDAAEITTPQPTDSHLTATALSATASGQEGSELFAAAGTVADEYRLLATPDGLTARSVDPANVAMNAVTAAPDTFASYTADPEMSKAPIGVPTRVEEYLTLWRQNDEFELHYNPKTNRLELGHDIFRLRIDTIDPDSIRSDPELPTIDGTATATVDADAFTDCINSFDESGNVTLAISDTGLFAIRVPDNGDGDATKLQTIRCSGRGVGIYSAEYLQDAVAASPTTSAETVTVRLGIESPVSLTVDFNDDTARTITTIAPRINPDDPAEHYGALDDIVSAPDADLSWATDRDRPTEDVPVLPFEKLQPESISTRVETYQYQQFPVETTVSLVDDDPAGYQIAHEEKIPVDEAVFDAVEAEIAESLTPDVVSVPQTVATVTFTDPDSYILDAHELELETEFRVSTDDGVRLKRHAEDPAHISYISPSSTTPCRRRLIIAATDSNDTEESYSVGVSLVDDSSNDVAAFTDLAAGFNSMAEAYSHLIDRVKQAAIETLIDAAGGTTSLPLSDVEDTLNTLTEPARGWNVTPTFYSDEYFAVLSGDGELLPDAEWNAQVIVEQPATDTGAYDVRYVVSMTANGPGDASVRDELAAADIGSATSRSEMVEFVETGLDTISEMGDWFVTSDPDDQPAWAAPDADDWVTRYLPIARDKLIRDITMADRDIPLALTDVPQIGPSRAETLTAHSEIDTTADVVAYLGTHRSLRHGIDIDELSTRAEDELTQVAETIWRAYIWPNRTIPGDYTQSTQTPPDNTTTTETHDATEPADSKDATPSETESETPPETQADTSVIDATVTAARHQDGYHYSVETEADTTLDAAVKESIREDVAAATPTQPCRIRATVATVTITDPAAGQYTIDVTDAAPSQETDRAATTHHG